MDKYERVVSFYDLRFFSRIYGQKEQLALIPIEDALTIACEMWRSDPLTRGRGAIQITLDDWKQSPTQGEHHIVINRADASMEDIPLKDTRTKVRRMAGKTIDEGIDLTAHILVKLAPTAKYTAKLLMTGGSSLPSAEVGNYLSQLFRQAKKIAKYQHYFSRPHPSAEAGKSISLTHHFELDSHPSVNLQEILRHGELQGLEVISLTQSALDSERKFTIAQKSVKLNLVNPGEPMLVSMFKKAINSAGRELRDNPTHAKLTYRPDGQKAQTTTLPINDLEQAFVKKERIKFVNPIQPMYETVSKTVIDKLRGLL